MPSGASEGSRIVGMVTSSQGAFENSPYLESFKANGQEVLLLTDPIDEFVAGALTEFKGKQLKAVDRGELGQVEWLLANGADVDAKDVGGETALTRARDSGDVALIDLLTKAGAKD